MLSPQRILEIKESMRMIDGTDADEPQKVSSHCLGCRCLDTTSLTESGYACMVGGDMSSENDCRLHLPRDKAKLS